MITMAINRNVVRPETGRLPNKIESRRLVRRVCLRSFGVAVLFHPLYLSSSRTVFAPALCAPMQRGYGLQRSAA